MAQKNTNLRVSVDTSQAKSQIEGLRDSIASMNEQLKTATESGDFRGAANIASAINNAQQAQRSISQQYTQSSNNGLNSASNGIVGAVNSAGGYAMALGGGNVSGAVSRASNGVGNSLMSAGKANSGNLGKALGMLGIAGLAVGAGASVVGGLSDQYQEYLPGLADFMRYSGGNESQWFRGATKYTEGTNLSQMDLIQLATQQAQYGLYGTDAMARAQMMGRFSYNTGVDTETLTRLQGISDRFGLSENAIGNAYGGFLKSGLDKGREQEFFDGVLRVMEEGISSGFVRSAEDVSKNLSMLSELSGGNAAWQGQYGAQKLSQINSGFSNATNLQSVTDVMLFNSALKLTENKNDYIGAMMTLEKGMDDPRLLDEFYKSVRETEGDNYTASIERFKQASGLNYTGAVELYNIAQKYNAGEYKDETAYNDAVKKVMENPQNMTQEKALTEAMNKLADATFGLKKEAFEVELATASGAGQAVVEIQKLLNDVFGSKTTTAEQKKLTYEEELSRTPGESKGALMRLALENPKDAGLNLNKLTKSGYALYQNLANEGVGNDDVDNLYKAVLGEAGLYKDPEMLIKALNIFGGQYGTMYEHGKGNMSDQEYISELVGTLVNRLRQEGLTVEN